MWLKVYLETTIITRLTKSEYYFFAKEVWFLVLKSFFFFLLVLTIFCWMRSWERKGSARSTKTSISRAYVDIGHAQTSNWLKNYIFSFMSWFIDFILFSMLFCTSSDASPTKDILSLRDTHKPIYSNSRSVLKLDSHIKRVWNGWATATTTCIMEYSYRFIL